METKHTPGPWSVLSDAQGYLVITTRKDQQFPICEVSTVVWESDAANANLIASAPGLLAALRAILARIDGVYDDPDLMAFGPLSIDESIDVAEIASQAIAKATGA